MAPKRKGTKVDLAALQAANADILQLPSHSTGETGADRNRADGSWGRDRMRNAAADRPPRKQEEDTARADGDFDWRDRSPGRSTRSRPERPIRSYNEPRDPPPADNEPSGPWRRTEAPRPASRAQDATSSRFTGFGSRTTRDPPPRQSGFLKRNTDDDDLGSWRRDTTKPSATTSERTPSYKPPPKPPSSTDPPLSSAKVDEPKKWGPAAKSEEASKPESVVKPTEKPAEKPTEKPKKSEAKPLSIEQYEMKGTVEDVDELKDVIAAAYSEQDADSILQYVKKITNDDRFISKVKDGDKDVVVFSLVPLYVIVRALVERCADSFHLATVGSSAEKTEEAKEFCRSFASDKARVDHIRSVIKIVSPAVQYLFDLDCDRPSPLQRKLRFLSFSVKVLAALGFPLLSKSLALSEAIWDGLYLECVLTHSDFVTWLEASDDDSPERTKVLFQLIHWSTWLTTPTDDEDEEEEDGEEEDGEEEDEDEDDD